MKQYLSAPQGDKSSYPGYENRSALIGYELNNAGSMYLPIYAIATSKFKGDLSEYFSKAKANFDYNLVQGNAVEDGRRRRHMARLSHFTGARLKIGHHENFDRPGMDFSNTANPIDASSTQSSSSPITAVVFATAIVGLLVYAKYH